ncbi:hypothetical protein ACFE04_012612 [Oxalis oulophora]
MIHGVSEKYFDYQGTIVFAKENNSKIPGLVSSILPSQEEVLRGYRLSRIYKCSTCEVDETSAMCISCFEHGDHSGHDYTITHYRGGCCDCGDITKLKPEGFCSEHKGILHPLGDEPFANSMAPVLDALFKIWKNILSDGMLEKFENYHYANELSRAELQLRSGLLELFIKSERFLGKNIVKKLHELLLELLQQHSFKYEFSKERSL